jgi:hypothetical protein
MRSRTETEMAFMGNVKSISVKSPASALNIFFRKLPGKVLEKFQIFSDTTAGLCGFSTLGEAQAASLQSQRAT